MAARDKKVSLKFNTQQHILMMKEHILYEGHADWLLELIESKAFF